MIVRRKAKGTLTAVEMFHADKLRFELNDKRAMELELVDTGAEIMHSTLKAPGVIDSKARVSYRFWADVLINDTPTRLEREVGTQKSFYEPWVFDGTRIWLDSVEAIFEFMQDNHGPCRPNRSYTRHLPPRHHARFALQDAEARICPDTVGPWYPLPEDGLRIEECYLGRNCWMGAHGGVLAHGGLDINQATGTPLYAPFNLDDQFLYNSFEMKSSDNRWRGIRQWPDGSVWVLSTSHMVRLTIPEHVPTPGGQQYAEGAGSGSLKHTHFGFAVFDHGEFIYLDPWILFWQMYRDQKAGLKTGTS